MKTLEKLKRLWNSYSVDTRRNIFVGTALLIGIAGMFCSYKATETAASTGSAAWIGHILFVADVGVALGTILLMAVKGGMRNSKSEKRGVVTPCAPRYRVDWTGLWSSKTAEGERCRKLGRLFFGLSAFVFATIAFAWLVFSNNWVTQAVRLGQHPMVIVAIMTLLVGETIVWFGIVAWAAGAAIDLRTHVIRRYEEMERGRRHDAGDRP